LLSKASNTTDLFLFGLELQVLNFFLEREQLLIRLVQLLAVLLAVLKKLKE
jgi:hypothetical protein